MSPHSYSHLFLDQYIYIGYIPTHESIRDVNPNYKKPPKTTQPRPQTFLHRKKDVKEQVEISPVITSHLSWV